MRSGKKKILNNNVFHIRLGSHVEVLVRSYPESWPQGSCFSTHTLTIIRNQIFGGNGGWSHNQKHCKNIERATAGNLWNCWESADRRPAHRYNNHNHQKWDTSLRSVEIKSDCFQRDAEDLRFEEDGTQKVVKSRGKKDLK